MSTQYYTEEEYEQYLREKQYYEQQEELLRQEQLRQEQQRTKRESQQRRPSKDSDEHWARRRKSDLMVGRINMPEYMLPGYRRVRVSNAAPAPQPSAPKKENATNIPIKIASGGKPNADGMWPRRKKSDLLIYQQTRHV